MIIKNHSNKELDNIGIKIEENIITYYDKTGKPTENKNLAVLKECNNKYFAKYYRGSLFDPFGIDEKKVSAPDMIYKEIKPNVHKLYFKYLQTRVVAHFLNACRLYSNGG